MLRAGRGYFFAYFVPEFLADTEEPAIQKIVDATDIYEVPAPRIAVNVPSSTTVNVFVNSGPADRFSPTPFPPPQQRTQFTARGVITTNANNNNAPPPRVVRPNGASLLSSPAPPAPPAPIPTVRMVNGTAVTSGQAYVYGVDPGADAARDRQARAYRERVPW